MSYSDIKVDPVWLGSYNLRAFSATHIAFRQIAMLKTSTTQIKKIVSIQFVSSLLAGVISWVLIKDAAASVLAGGLIASLSNGYFAWKVFAKQRETESAQILSTYYRAEVGKIILTVMLFVFAISVIKPLNVIALMSAYLLITMIPWLASFFINNDKDYDNKNWREKNVS